MSHERKPVPVSEAIEWLKGMPEGAEVVQLSRETDWQIDVMGDGFSEHSCNPVMTIIIKLPRQTLHTDTRLVA